MTVKTASKDIGRDFYGTRDASGNISVDERLPGQFMVHGLFLAAEEASAVRYIVAVSVPNERLLSPPIYEAAKRFAASYDGGHVEHGPFEGAPHVFAVVFPIASLSQLPADVFGWTARCLFTALCTAIDHPEFRDQKEAS